MSFSPSAQEDVIFQSESVFCGEILTLRFVLFGALFFWSLCLVRPGELGSKMEFEELYSSLSLICEEACDGYVSSNKSSLPGISNKPISILQNHTQECVLVGPQQRKNGIGFPSINILVLASLPSANQYFCVILDIHFFLWLHLTEQGCLLQDNE